MADMTGGNMRAALLSGLRVKRLLVLTCFFAGAAAAIRSKQIINCYKQLKPMGRYIPEVTRCSSAEVNQSDIPNDCR